MTKSIAKQKHDTLANHVAADKWTAQRERERITPRNIPHLNSTMKGTYGGEELSYRGRAAS